MSLSHAIKISSLQNNYPKILRQFQISKYNCNTKIRGKVALWHFSERVIPKKTIFIKCFDDIKCYQISFITFLHTTITLDESIIPHQHQTLVQMLQSRKGEYYFPKVI